MSRRFASSLTHSSAHFPAAFAMGSRSGTESTWSPTISGCSPGIRRAHVFNAWTRMPEIGVQAEMPGAFTGDCVAARALLRCGQTYENAVKTFEPYRLVKEPNPATREALRKLAEAAKASRTPAFLFVNNRLEGNAPSTIEAVASSLLSSGSERVTLPPRTFRPRSLPCPPSSRYDYKRRHAALVVRTLLLDWVDTGKALQGSVGGNMIGDFTAQIAGVAQPVEHRFCKPRVVSSSPTASSAGCLN